MPILISAHIILNTLYSSTCHCYIIDTNWYRSNTVYIKRQSITFFNKMNIWFICTMPNCQLIKYIWIMTCQISNNQIRINNSINNLASNHARFGHAICTNYFVAQWLQSRLNDMQ